MLNQESQNLVADKVEKNLFLKWSNKITYLLLKLECALLLSTDIYCFGGYVQGSSKKESELISLSLLIPDRVSLYELNARWEDETPSNPFDVTIGRRHGMQAATDGDCFFFKEDLIMN